MLIDFKGHQYPKSVILYAVFFYVRYGTQHQKNFATEPGIARMWDGLDAPYLERGWLVELGQLRVRTKNAYYLTYSKKAPTLMILHGHLAELL